MEHTPELRGKCQERHVGLQAEEVGAVPTPRSIRRGRMWPLPRFYD